MRRLFFVTALTVLATAFTVSFASSGTVTFNFNTAEGLDELGITKPTAENRRTAIAGVPITKDGITITQTDKTDASSTSITNIYYVSDGSYSYRIYGNDATMTFTASSAKITKITFTASTLTFSPSVGTLNSSTKTWTGSSNSVTFTCTSTSQITSVTVTYETSYLFIVGQVNGKSWSPTDVVTMGHDNNNNFIADVWFSGTNNDNDGNGDFDLFYFSTEKGSENNWTNIDNNNLKGVVGNTGERCWIADNGTYSLSHTGTVGDLRATPGVYHLSVNEAKTTLSVSQITPTVGFSEAAGEVDVNTVITITSNLTTIGGEATGAVIEYSTDNGSTWTAGSSFTMDDYDMDVTLLARATLGDHISATASARFTTPAPVYRYFMRITTTEQYTAALNAGKAFILVNPDETRAMGAQSDYHFRYTGAISVNEYHRTAITTTGAVSPLIITNVGNAAVTIQDEKTSKYLGYIYYDSPYLVSTETASTTFGITIQSGGHAAIWEKASGTSMYLHNSGNFFGLYDSDTSTPYLFVEVDDLIPVEPKPGDFTRVTSLSDLQPGREYIIVSENDEVVMGQPNVLNVNTNSYRNSVSASPSAFVLDSSHGLATVLSDDIAVLRLEGSFDVANNRFNAKFYDIKNKAYLAWNSGNSIALSDESDNSFDANLYISISNDNSADIQASKDSQATRLLQFNPNSGDERFAFYSDALQAPVLYYRERTIVPLAWLYSNAIEGNEYTIDDDLTVMLVRDQVASDRNGYNYQGIMVLKDANGSAVAPYFSQPMEYNGNMQNELQIAGENSIIRGSGLQSEYDQSNWMIFSLYSPNNAFTFHTTFAEGDIIKAGQIKGIYEGGRIELRAYTDNDAYSLPNAPDKQESVTPVYNVYTPANFLQSNLNWNGVACSNEYFWMTPKPLEVAYIIWAVYSNGGFYMPKKGETLGGHNHNGADQAGFFSVNFAEGFTEGEGISSSTTPQDVFTDNTAYQFMGIINYEPQASGIAPKLGNRSTLSIEPKTGEYESDYSVTVSYLDRATSVVTGIEPVIIDDNDKTVKSVRFFNAAGVELVAPSTGINIIVTEFDDGTKSTSKILK